MYYHNYKKEKKSNMTNEYAYHINLVENFKVDRIDHETEKAYLFSGEGFKFWCPKKLIKRPEDSQNIDTWLVWNQFEPNFIQDEIKPRTNNLVDKDKKKKVDKLFKEYSNAMNNYFVKPCKENQFLLMDADDALHTELSELLEDVEQKLENQNVT